MLTNIRKNCMGTVSFDGQFDGMRKAQDFIVYPMHPDIKAEKVAHVQSDTRIGEIDLTTGTVNMSLPRAGGAYYIHMATARIVGKLTSEELLLFKAQIFATAGEKVGDNVLHVVTDNSGAAQVFGVQS